MKDVNSVNKGDLVFVKGLLDIGELKVTYVDYNSKKIDCEIKIDSDEIKLSNLPFERIVFPKWEMFCDDSYFGLWAVRPVNEKKSMSSPRLFHFDTREQAKQFKKLVENAK